ncbi:unnamed protein product [Linum tenue]|uniref:Uncharacterized protein n=1 Tax=Linum tenue TaxID=586396 RepID=A0AAV0RLR6_9ROSI|nr:unnamed protein product [Linum tenue]
MKELCLLLLLLLLAAASGGLPPAEVREVYGNGQIFDITHGLKPNLCKFGSAGGVGPVYTLVQSIKNGSAVNEGEINRLGTHTGTHVDTPGHFYQDYYDAGYTLESLDMAVLNGPALLVDVPRDSNITAKVMESLQIPKGTRRVLFRTLNTDRRLMYKTEFDSSFVGFMADGAQWLVDNTDIKLVGVDYISVGAFVEDGPAHLALLKSREIIVVEGMKLDDVEAGHYNVHCLPIRLVGADGAPARCILIKNKLYTTMSFESGGLEFKSF